MATIKGADNRYKNGIIACVIVIMGLTILEFPAPVGFETRPQDNVSLGWLFFFVTIVLTEILTISLIIKKPRSGVVFGIVAGGLNILQVIADQFHLMQPEVASLGYSLLEYSVAAVSVMLIYLSIRVYQRESS